MRVAVLAEFYPRAHDPVLGVWAHRQAQAARAAGADIHVFVLHRIVPPARTFTAKEFRRLLTQPGHTVLDGVPVTYVRYVSPRRSRAYADWGRWAAPPLRRAFGRAEHRGGRFDVIHAHNAVPAGDAALRVAPHRPLIVSVHGGDVLWTVDRVPHGADVVGRTLSRAALTLANSQGIAELTRRHGAARAEVLHLGADIPQAPGTRAPDPVLVTVGHLVARKRHADVIAALAQLPSEVRYRIIGDGPERAALAAVAQRLGVADRVEFTGQLAHDEALHGARDAWLFVMPSTDEAFGVAYIEAMAAGIPSIGAAGEPGPAEIAAVGPGIELVPPRAPDALATHITGLLTNPERLATLSAEARATVEAEFTWSACGQRTLDAYRAVLAGTTAGSHRHA
jgi:teichuronic acid biosynthesis glycosyltransferase TuaC